METNNGSKIHGKRKLIAVVLYTCGVFVIGSGLVAASKITGQEFISALGAAKYVVIAYLGVNAAGAAINKFGKKQ
ncbi:MAG: hypothetical protein KAS32_27080 [Candidatus Peribacteraceae bacterium]|nr:hypothetical protein [Candidatus Peribacteraceae bacterium]